MAAFPRLETSDAGDVTVVRFHDRRIANLLEIEEVGKELHRLLEEGTNVHFVLDFSGVDYLSSALIGKLVSLNAKVQARNGSVKLCSLRPEIVAIFHACKLDRIFPINQDEADALPSF